MVMPGPVLGSGSHLLTGEPDRDFGFLLATSLAGSSQLDGVAVGVESTIRWFEIGDEQVDLVEREHSGPGLGAELAVIDG